tara:strand:- start:13552 stop:14313 length:762 start_codon:yes stop_codon:yes gene_type:complete
MTDDQIDELLDLAYTVNWFIAERWNDPKSQELAKTKNVEMLKILTGGAYGADEETKPIIPVAASDGPALKVAVVVGHNSRNKGAYIKGSLNEFEYDFNNEVAEEMIRQKWPELTLKRFNRSYAGSYSSEIAKVYRSVNAWNPDFILELHFNGYNGKVGYSFMLHYAGSETSRKCAKAMNDAAVKVTGFEDKGTRALSSGDRGYLSVKSAGAPAVLTEPFFGDYSPHAEKVSVMGHAGIARLYLDGIKEVAKIL